MAPEGRPRGKDRCRPGNPGLDIPEGLDAARHLRRRREDAGHRVIPLAGRKPFGEVDEPAALGVDGHPVIGRPAEIFPAPG